MKSQELDDIFSKCEAQTLTKDMQCSYLPSKSVDIFEEFLAQPKAHMCIMEILNYTRRRCRRPSTMFKHLLFRNCSAIFSSPFKGRANVYINALGLHDPDGHHSYIQCVCRFRVTFTHAWFPNIC